MRETVGRKVSSKTLGQSPSAPTLNFEGKFLHRRKPYQPQGGGWGEAVYKPIS